MAAATVENYTKIYWTGLVAQLDAIDTALYDDLAANAAVTLELFDHSFLTAAQINQAQALLICVECAGAPSLAGYSQERHFSDLKIADRKMSKLSGLDWSIGEFCRLLKITPQEFNAKTSAVREAQFKLYRTNAIYLAPDLDGRGRVFKDFDPQDVRDDRNSYPLDSRYPSRRGVTSDTRAEY